MDIKTKNNNMKVIILSKSNYKEKDCIYSAIGPEGFISFMAKGAQDPKSKYIWLNNPMTVADVEFLQDGRYKHKIINNATLISSPMLSTNNYDYLVAIHAVAELTGKVLPDEEKHLIYNEVEPVLNALRSGKDYCMVILVYFAKLIKLSGAGLEVGKCARCGSKHEIVKFDLDEGGFLCKNCINEDTVLDLSKDQLYLVRYIFMAKDYSLPESEKFSLKDKKTILYILSDFLDGIDGVKLSSLEVLIK